MAESRKSKWGAYSELVQIGLLEDDMDEQQALYVQEFAKFNKRLWYILATFVLILVGIVGNLAILVGGK